MAVSGPVCQVLILGHELVSVQDKLIDLHIMKTAAMCRARYSCQRRLWQPSLCCQGHHRPLWMPIQAQLPCAGVQHCHHGLDPQPTVQRHYTAGPQPAVQHRLVLTGNPPADQQQRLRLQRCSAQMMHQFPASRWAGLTPHHCCHRCLPGQRGRVRYPHHHRLPHRAALRQGHQQQIARSHC